jgi:hypothetical protein
MESENRDADFTANQRLVLNQRERQDGGGKQWQYSRQIRYHAATSKSLADSDMSSSEKHPRSSNAHTPDLDWSQVRETVLMMDLTIAQIEAAMRDSNSSVGVLTDAFTTMANHMRMLDETIAALPESSMPAETRGSLLGTAGQVSGLVHQAIIAFQFYDKLVQRLSHVNHNVAALADLVGDRARLYNPQEWVELQQAIRSKYTMREEVEMFEAVLSGISVEEALETFMAKTKSNDDDIELF